MPLSRCRTKKFSLASRDWVRTGVIPRSHRFVDACAIPIINGLTWFYISADIEICLALQQSKPGKTSQWHLKYYFKF